MNDDAWVLCPRVFVFMGDRFIKTGFCPFLVKCMMNLFYGRRGENNKKFINDK